MTCGGPITSPNRSRKVTQAQTPTGLVRFAPFLCGIPVFSQPPSESAADLAKYAMKLRESSLVRIEPKIARTLVNNRLQISDLSNEPVSAISVRNSRGIGSSDYTWKLRIATTVFWIGEQASTSNPVSNEKSAWDSSWISSYGGTDTPVSEERLKFAPASFIPRQNPFYVALPYNDVDDHHTKPEAVQVIPWYQNSFVRDGQSVCKGRWVAIRLVTKYVTRSGRMSARFRRITGNMCSGMNVPDQTETETPGWTCLRRSATIWASTTSISVTGNSSTSIMCYPVPGRFTGITTFSAGFTAANRRRVP